MPKTLPVRITDGNPAAAFKLRESGCVGELTGCGYLLRLWRAKARITHLQASRGRSIARGARNRNALYNPARTHAGEGERVRECALNCAPNIQTKEKTWPNQLTKNSKQRLRKWRNKEADGGPVRWNSVSAKREE